jgi:hypothetical protein
MKEKIKNLARKFVKYVLQVLFLILFLYVSYSYLKDKNNEGYMVVCPVVTNDHALVIMLPVEGFTQCPQGIPLFKIKTSKV